MAKLNLTLICCLFLASTAFGQLKINSTGNVGIGVDPAFTSHLRLLKSANPRHNLFLSSNFTISTSNNAGIYNEATTSTSNIPLHGVYNLVSNNSTNYVFGIFNDLQAGGSGSKIGFRNIVSDDSGSAWNSANWMNGIDVTLTHKYYPKAWGSKISINNINQSAADEVFGQQISITGTGIAKSIGLKVSVPSGANNYAAQFTGPVTVNGSLVLTSDRELKENIVEIREAMSIITRLSPKTYAFRGDTRFNFDPEEKQYGFLAQEVEEILPSLVKDVYHAPVYQPGYIKGVKGPDGEEMSEEEAMLYPARSYKAVKYIDFIPILVQAMKEQQSEIENLREALENPFGRSVNGGSQVTQKIQALAQENVQLKADLLALSSIVNDLKTEIADLKECTDCYGNRDAVDMGVIEVLVSIYPNPANSQVTINTKLEGEYEVKVLTADGRLLMANKYASRVITVNTSEWASGTYLFEVVTQKGEIADRVKVVIMK